MNKVKELHTLKRNTIIIAISNIGSKAIAFILAPLYSYYLSPEQYGVMDLIITMGGLLLPVLCLDIFEATFRYTSDSKYSRRTVLSSSLFILILETAIICIGLTAISQFISIPYYLIIVLVCTELDSLFQVLIQFVRGKNMMISYAFSGIVYSVTLLISNLCLLVLMARSLDGWIISFLIAKSLTCIYAAIVSKVWTEFSWNHVSKEFISEALAYCLPLLPNMIMWWIMNLSDRLLITFYIGVAATGIYAVASKVPSILGVFENIFFQSWQTSAINTVNGEDRDAFYSRVFEKYMIFLTLGILGVLIILKPIINIFSNEYSLAWGSSGILVITVMLHALGGNLGALYAALKSTKGALLTSLYGALTNIVLNIFLIPIWGLVAAAITTLIGYAVVLAMRWVDLRKYVKLKIGFRNVLFCSLLIVFQTCLYYLNHFNAYLVIIQIIVLTIGCIVYKKDIFALMRK